MTCRDCGSAALYGSGGNDHDNPFACTYCDSDRLPMHLRHPYKRLGYVPGPVSRAYLLEALVGYKPMPLRPTP